MSRQTYIFATRSDLEPGLRRIEAKRSLVFMLCGSFESSSRQIWNSLLEVKGLGLNPQGDHNRGDRFLVLDRAIRIDIRKVLQPKGGVRYFVDQLANPTSIVISPGGLYLDNGLVCGHIGTASDHAGSVVLYKQFTKALKTGFEHIGNYWVGPEAVHLLDGHTRLLTMGFDEPSEYDLKRP
jgi:hypothetical protein